MDPEKLQSNDEDIRVLRTYTSDMADAVRENEASVIKIALAEKDKREREKIYKEADGTKSSKIFFILGGIFLIVAAIVGSTFLLSKKEKTSIPVVKNTNTFIVHDSYLFEDLTDLSKPEDLFAKINQVSETTPGTVRAIFLSKMVNEISKDLTTSDFISQFGINAPGALTRSLTNKYLLGQYFEKDSSGRKIKYFLIFETNNYNQAYASLLSWETTMLKDLSVFFKSNTQEENNSQRKWQDLVINNIDVRVLYGDNGQTVLYYAFINNKLLIADNIDGLKEIINRLIAKNV